MSKHYVVIDTNSGYIWGDTHAESAQMACAVIDSDIDKGTEYDYAEVNRGSGTATYAVYALKPGQFDLMWADDGNAFYDGQDQDLIDLVTKQAQLDCYIARTESE